MGHVENPKIQVTSVVTIASYYREPAVSQRVSVLSKCIKNRKITFFVDDKEVSQ